MIFLNLLSGIHDYFFGMKILKPKVVLMECKMNNIETTWASGWGIGPLLWLPLRQAQANAEWVSTYFVFGLHETTKISNLPPKYS